MDMFEIVNIEEWRDVLRRLNDPDVEVKEVAFENVSGYDDLDSSPVIDSTDQLALLKIGLTHEFPVHQRRHWDHSEEKVISALWFRPNGEYASIISTLYANATPSAKLASLVLLAVQGTEEAAIVFSQCIKSSGWPDRLYQRVFIELRHLLPHAKHLFPDLILHADEQLANITNTFVKAMMDGRLEPDDLLPAKAHVEKLVSEDVQVAKVLQQPSSGSWMEDEEYWTIRTRLGAALDIIGWIPGANLDSTKEALDFTDNQIRMFAMGALLRQGNEPSPELLEELAASHAIRNNFFYLLKSRDRLDLFPPDLLTLDAFAASEMVGWLSYPSELGEPPKELELIARICGEEEGIKKVAYLWRFSTEDGKHFAGMSGSYDVQAEIGPVFGDHTFSAFNEWDSMSKEKHIEAIVQTLEDWSSHKVQSPTIV